MARTSNQPTSSSKAKAISKAKDACAVITSASKRRRTVNHERVASLRDDGSIVVHIERDRKNTNTLSPTPVELKNLFDSTEDLPLDIDFNEFTTFPEPPTLPPKVLEQYFDLILDVLPRWRSLVLWAGYISTESLLKRELPDAPLLETVVLSGLPEWDLPLVCTHLAVCWKNSPRFQRYENRQFHEGTFPTHVPHNPLAWIPLRQLMTLRVDNQMTAQQCIDVLCHAVALEDCAFTNVRGPGAIAPTFVHQSLKSLKLAVNFEDHSQFQPTFLWCIFDVLKAPALQRLSLECDDGWRNDTFLRFIQTSQCQLLALEFVMVPLFEKELTTILLHVPKLQALKIHGDSSQSPQAVSPKILRALTNTTDQPMLCPELVAISLNDDAMEDIRGGSFSLMISSRMGGTPLKVLWLAMKKEDPDHQIDIQHLVQVHKDNPKVLDSVQICEIDAGRWVWDRHVAGILKARENTVASSGSGK
ncbi:hypothetical protein M413DRAFT_27760 [Hebeloma cylindrosporum]|uniref:F-box domain-containing protein n=1 Tax=Hebeloma cylindrosporum TaxID=76867 RepID=A0A0C3CCR6_HEBCY|nr:hypothetical protein M413DRAFT_27760 [Hebeloma cylindrosporum h7]